MGILERPSLKIKTVYLFFVLMFFLPTFIQAQTNTSVSPDPLLTPWIGVWTIVDDQPVGGANDPSARPIVEISPTDDGKGLNISRKVPQKADVQEALIPDGVRRTIKSNKCTGWQTSKWLPEAGLIVGSSEINCKESESYTISSLRMIVSPDRMVDILNIKASGQTRIAVRHLVFSNDFPSTGESSSQLAMAARMSISAPWDLNKIIQLSKMIDVSSFQAALMEKNSHINLNPKSLKQMTAANVPKPVIDLLVAQAFPEKFAISKNGQVAVAPSIKSEAYDRDSSTTPSAIIYPASRYGGYYYPFGYLGNYPGDLYWSYYSPFWYGYPIYLYNPGGSGNSGGSPGSGGGPATGGQLSVSRGYVQITPRDTGRQAVPIHGYVQSSGRSAGYAQAVPSGGTQSSSGASSGASYSAPPASSGGGNSSGGGSSYSGSSSGGGASASPAGYSSGSSSGGQAVPR
jgi:hypothetical protein